MIDHYKPGGLNIPSAGDDEQVWRRWEKWQRAIEAKKSVQETMSDSQQYVDVYKRYAEDQTQYFLSINLNSQLPSTNKLI